MKPEPRSSKNQNSMELTNQIKNKQRQSNKSLFTQTNGKLPPSFDSVR